jgi:serine/threonine-protein kinase
MTPETLGRYEIVGELGKGAMGVVYLARDPIIHRQLAIKTFRMAYSAKEKEVQQFRERFLREAQAIGRLSHPNIVTVHDVGQEDDEYFIAMEYIKGINLKQRMQSTDDPLPLDFVIDVAAQIAEGLACAHEEGIVHRDVKPANIIIAQSRRVKITDFGIARIEQSNLTVAGQLLGTPNYMAPEQIQGKTVDARTDIFSLGVLLYEMLTRKKPFAGENLTQVSHRIVYDEFTSPDEIIQGLPPELIAILDRALEKDPDQRYQDAAEMARDLRALQEPVSGAVPVVKAPAGTAELEAEPVGLPPSQSFTDVPPAPPAPAGESVPPAAPPPPPPAEPASSAALSPAAPAAPPASAPVPPVTSGVVAETLPPPSVAAVPGTRSPPAANVWRLPKAWRLPKVWRLPSVPEFSARMGMALAALVVGGIGAMLILARVLGGAETDAGTLEPSRLEKVRQEEQELIRLAREPMPGMSSEHALGQLLMGIKRVPTSIELTRAYFDLAERADREHDIVADYVRERMAYTNAFISAKKYESAYDVLELILLVDPENEEAISKAEDIERFLSRKRRDQIAAQEAERRRPPPERAPPPRPVAARPAAAVPVDLSISFRTLIAEGEVTLFAADSPIWQKKFNFDNRKVFKRKYLKGERGFDEAYSLTSGTVELRVRVEVDTKDGPRSLEGDLVRSRLSEGDQPTLKIEVSEDATLRTTWIP